MRGNAPCVLLSQYTIVIGPRAFLGSQAAQPQLEDGSVYRARWWACTYRIANFSVGGLRWTPKPGQVVKLQSGS